MLASLTGDEVGCMRTMRTDGSSAACAETESRRDMYCPKASDIDTSREVSSKVMCSYL